MPQIIPPDQPQYDTLGRPIPPLPIAPIMQQQPAAMPSPIIAPVAQQQQQAPAAIPPQAPAAPAAPSFSPLPEGSAQAAFRTGVAQIPQRSDYQAHGLHRVLNAIAGGFAGAAGHPEAGRELADLPYTRAVEDYNRKSNALKVGADIETERQQEGTKQYVAANNADYKLAEVQRQNDQLRINQQKADEAVKNTQSEIEARIARQKEADDKLAAANKAIEAHKGNVQRILDAKTPAERDAVIAAIRDTQKSDEQIKQEAADKAEGAAEVAASPLGQRAAGAKAGSTAQAVMNVKTNEDNIQKQTNLAQRLIDAKAAAKRSEQAVAASDKAKIALDQYPRIMSELNELSELPFADRWKNFLAGTVGNNPEFEPIRLNVGLLQSLVAQIHVQRTGAVILKKFEGLFNADKMNKATLTSGLKELKYWLDAYAKNPNAPPGGDLDRGNVPGVTSVKGLPSVNAPRRVAYPGMDDLDPNDVVLQPRK